MKENIVFELYTDKIRLYHLVFNGLFRYKVAVGSFYEKANYLRSNMKVLDAGCGSGNHTINLHDISIKKNLKGIQYHGFDITPAMLKMFKNWISIENVKNIQLLQADVLKLNNLPEKWKDYDLIVTSAMLEYIPKSKIKIALTNLRELLKPNGTLLIYITRQNFIMNLLIKKWWKANTYKKKEIKAILEESGFSKINFRIFPPPFSYLNLWGYVIEIKK